MEYILHMHNHAGWHTQRIEADTLEAAIDEGLKARALFLSNEYEGQYKIECDDPNDDHPLYRIIWDDEEPKTFVWGTPKNRGDVWWSDRFEVGSKDDCTSCGGTGVNHYNPFVECWACGDGVSRGKSSGKKIVNG